MAFASTYYEHLHKNPELSGQEFQTAEYIFSCLQEMGYAPQRIGKTGVYADLVTDAALPWVLLRADIDALPIQEDSDLAYTSRNEGVMHACGHDSHASMLLEAADRLKNENLPQNIRFLFQPAEEATQGAAEMIENGVIPENLTACFAMHVWPGITKGVPFAIPGPQMASSDVYKITIHGKSAHCAQSHLGNDALQTAVSIGAKLPEIKALSEDPRTILFLGSIHSGHSHNIVPDDASLWGTIRTYSPEDRQTLKSTLETTVAEMTKKFGTTADFIWDGGCPAVRNDPELVTELSRLIPEMSSDVLPTLAAEDFACYLEHAPGVLIWLGAGDTAPLHNPRFVVPQELLPIGVSLWLKIASHPWKAV